MPYLIYSIIGSLFLGILFLILGYSLTEELVSVFASDDKEVVNLAARGLRFYLPAYLLMDLGIVIGYYFHIISYLNICSVECIFK